MVDSGPKLPLAVTTLPASQLHGPLRQYLIDCSRSLYTESDIVMNNHRTDAPWFFLSLSQALFGRDFSLTWERLQALNRPQPTCGHVFEKNEPTYQCRDCGNDPTCVLCVRCFKAGPHRGHNYRMNNSNGGGMCDCGDREAWAGEPFCDVHRPSADAHVHDPVSDISTDLRERATSVFRTILEYVSDSLSLPEKARRAPELFASDLVRGTLQTTMVYNDETHTFDEVIRKLVVAVGCTRKDAQKYAELIDKEGRAVVCMGDSTRCERVMQDLRNQIDLVVDVKDASVVAHQLCSLLLLSWLHSVSKASDALRAIIGREFVRSDFSPTRAPGQSLVELALLADASLWKNARSRLHDMYMGCLIVDAAFKRDFSVAFARNYVVLQEQFLEDSHTAGDSVIQMSVQVFTVPSIVRMLVAEYGLLDSIMETLLRLFRTAVVHEGGPIDCTAPVMLSHRYFHMFVDLRYILRHDSIDFASTNFLRHLLEFLFLMQHMDEVTRQTGEHVEIESESWMGAFTLCLHVMPITPLLSKAYASSPEGLRVASLRTLEALHMHPSMQGFVFDDTPHGRFVHFDMATQPVSLHLPLHRALAGLLQDAHRHSLLLHDVLHLGERNMDPAEAVLMLLEHPLRVAAFLAQAKAGMWVLNGFSIQNQIFNYVGVNFRDQMFDRDLTVLQAAAALLGPDMFIAAALHKFNLLDFFLGDAAAFAAQLEKDADARRKDMVLAEEFLQLLITVVGERMRPGVGRVSFADIVRREIVHRLCLGPIAYSELAVAVGRPISEDPSFEATLRAIAVFRQPLGLDSGMYELRPEMLAEYDPYFFHYTRREREKAEAARVERLRKRSEPTQPVTVPPRLTVPFAGLAHVLHSHAVAGIVRTVLRRAVVAATSDPNTPADPFAPSDALVYAAVHIAALALIAAPVDASEENGDGGAPELRTRFALLCAEGGAESILGLLARLADQRSAADLRPVILWVLRTARETGLPEVLAVLGGATAGEDGGEDPKAKRAREALERRNKVMAQFAAMQKSFVAKNADMLAEAEAAGDGPSSQSQVDEAAAAAGNAGAASGVAESTLAPLAETVTCILCQEEARIGDHGDRAAGLVALVQSSGVLRSLNKTTEPRDDPAGHVHDGHAQSSGAGMRVDSPLRVPNPEPTVPPMLHIPSRSATPTSPMRPSSTTPPVQPPRFAGRLREASYDDNNSTDDTPRRRHTVAGGPQHPAPTGVHRHPSLSVGVHVGSCGHAMHFDCFDRYFRMVMQKHVTSMHTRLRVERVERSEFICPLCKALGNAFLPLVPARPRTSAPEPTMETEYPEGEFRAVYLPMLARLLGGPGGADEERSVDGGAAATAASVNGAGGASGASGNPVDAPLSFLARLREFLGHRRKREDDARDGGSSVSEMVECFLSRIQQMDGGVIGADPLALGPAGWNACSYTLASLEAAARASESGISLPDGVPERAITCARSLFRALGTACDGGLFAGMPEHLKAVLNLVSARESTGDLSLLSADPFNVLVWLCFVLPPEVSGRFSVSHFHHSVRLAYLAHVTQTALALAVGPEDSPEFALLDTECENDGLLPLPAECAAAAEIVQRTAQCAGLATACGADDGARLALRFRHMSRTFLRRAALLMHAALEMPIPRVHEGEIESLLGMLGLPGALVDVCRDLAAPSPFGDGSLLERWCDAYRTTLVATASPADSDAAAVARSLLPGFGDIGSMALVPLATDFNDLFHEATSIRCVNCKTIPSLPALCLTCGRCLCAQSQCCHGKAGGECRVHSLSCGAGMGLFLLVKRCVIVVTHIDRGTFFNAPYLDAHGETDVLLRRGHPLFLNAQRYAQLNRMWLSHAVATDIARALDQSSNTIDWTQF